MRFVITGGPGVGKTTILRELERLGHHVVPETGRAIIKEEQQKPNGILPWKDLYTFQILVVARQLALETRIEGSPAFLDRGVLDGLAYCIAGNIPTPPELEIVRPNYKGVFLLDPLGTYATDAERKEDAEHARRIHSAIETVYTRSGIPLVRVPVLPPAERTQYILEHVRRIQ